MAQLPDRGVALITGDDAGKFLQGLITNDMALLAIEPAIHTALLSSQGKILFDFFVVKSPDGYLLEAEREKLPELVKRLAMYKLRAKVAIADASDDYRVIAVWGNAPSSHCERSKSISFTDPRLAELGLRVLAHAQTTDGVAAAANASEASPVDYHAHRIALGVPEGGKDYSFGDTFPHEALFDQLHGVSFTKGCFVGQEVVARMKHRASARKRVVPVIGSSDLPAPGTEIKAGEVAIGKLGSVASNRGLALVRLDRAAEFAAKGVGLSAGSVPVTIELPAFATFSLEQHTASA
jgi:folate-binding protein YgfZ